MNYGREVGEIAAKIHTKMAKSGLTDSDQITDEAGKWIAESPRSWQPALVIETLLCTESPHLYLSGPLSDPSVASPMEVVARAANRAFLDDIVRAVRNLPGHELKHFRTRASNNGQQ